MRRVTIADVAEKAGVSPTAVSFAFNKPDQLNGETTNRIRNVAIELGYMPNPLARALISRRVGVLGVLMPQPLGVVLANAYFHTFLQGISSMCDEERLSILSVSPLNGSLDHALTNAPVDGFIIVGFNESHHEVAMLQRRKIPYVVVDGEATTAPSVNVDDEAGAYSAARHLLSAGHRDILVLMLEAAFGHAREQVHGVGMRRMRGYQRAFAEAGATWRENWVIPTVSTTMAGESSLEAAHAYGLHPTAILAASDVIAIGALQCAAHLQLRVPADLEVIGFDDTTLASIMKPALSTVRQPIFEKGRTAVEMLVREIEGEPGVRHVMLPTELILRDTTRPRAGENEVKNVALAKRSGIPRSRSQNNPGGDKIKSKQIMS